MDIECIDYNSRYAEVAIGSYRLVFRSLGRRSLPFRRTVILVGKTWVDPQTYERNSAIVVPQSTFVKAKEFAIGKMLEARARERTLRERHLAFHK